MPTTESSSPTATRAVKENRRPPLTTLATRLISITRSWRSRPCGLTVSMSGFTFKAQITVASWNLLRPSKSQPALAGALCQRLHAAVVLIAAPVEQAALHPRLLRAPGEDLAGLLRLLERTELAQLGLGPRD